MINPRSFNLILLLLAAAGCDTRSLIGREPPPDSGVPENPAPVGKPDDIDAAAPVVEDASPSGSVDTGPLDLGLPVIVDPPFTIPDNLVGTWKGYLQAAIFRSGSDTVVVNLFRTQGEPDRITVTLGDSAPTSTPPYPLDAQRGGGTAFYVEGIPYQAHQVLWRGSRLTFQIANGDIYRSWCATQVPHVDPNSSPERYACGGIDDTIRALCYKQDPPVAEGCEPFLVCNYGLCVCNASGCGASTALTAAFDITFDLPVVGATTVGGNNVTLRLTRAAQAAAQ